MNLHNVAVLCLFSVASGFLIASTTLKPGCDIDAARKACWVTAGALCSMALMILLVGEVI